MTRTVIFYTHSLVAPCEDKKRLLIPWVSILMAQYLQMIQCSSEVVLVMGISQVGVVEVTFVVVAGSKSR
jgi:hypothetical protein